MRPASIRRASPRTASLVLRRGVVRGLHVRSGDGEAKLVRCSYGAIFDVIVDLRPSSPTHGNWESFDLRGDTQVSLYIPAGCAHGFQALTEPADVSYRIDRPHDPAEDVSIAFDDPDLAIPWPFPVAAMSRARPAGAATLGGACGCTSRSAGKERLQSESELAPCQASSCVSCSLDVERERPGWRRSISSMRPG